MIYKIFRIGNLQQVARFCIKLVYFLLSVTNTLAWRYVIAYYGMCKLQICSVFIVQSLGAIQIKIFWSKLTHPLYKLDHYIITHCYFLFY
jgi:hypothetical protein